MARLTEMTNGDIRKMYVENRIYTSPYSTAKHGGIVSVPHEGRRIAIQAKPIAPVADYEKWLRNRNRYNGGGGGSKCTGAKIRRIVIMRRQGSSWKECGEAVGVVGSAAKAWVEFLPFELSV
jgi:hypothetical protein